jgi:CubicO group peptidase (beta-lactamase class C family)
MFPIMNSYKRIVFCALMSSWFFVTRAQSQEPHYSNAVEKKIKEVENNLAGWVQIDDSTRVWNLMDRMKFYRVKGLSIAVIHNYKLEWARGYGWADEAEQRPVTVNTLFQAGSISKSLNSVGVMKLEQEKKISLDDDINHYLKSWQFPYDSLSKGKIITLRNLLSHSAGLSVHGFPGYETGDSLPTIYQVLNGQRPANTAAVRSMIEPGLKYIYSGGGTTISQVMVTDATNMPYDQYMWQNVLKPLGMTNSSYQQPPNPLKSSQLATGYLWAEKEVKGKHHVYPEQAAAGLWTNPIDLSKYIIETQLSYEGKSSKVLSSATTRIRVTPYVDSTTALGCFISKIGDTRYFSHGGSDVGFLSIYYGNLKSGDGVVVQINSDFARSLLTEVVYSVARVYGWNDFYTPEYRKTVHPPADSLLQYTGVYSLSGDTISIHRQGDTLYYASNFMACDHFEPLLFVAPGRFFMYEEGHADFYADRGPDGVIRSIKIIQSGRPDDVFTRQAKTVQFSNRF